LLRWSTFPLQELAADVSGIEAGERDQLQGSYPSELLTVTKNLNLLIRSERERQSRYRTTLEDLAHSLKTPLAVLSTALQESTDNQVLPAQQRQEMKEQLDRMDQIVSWQLKRAVKSNHNQWLAKPVPVTPVIEKLLSALQKVYRDKAMQLETHLDEKALFYGEKSDLMEICGNLLDNAFKYGNSKVAVSTKTKGRRLVIEVSDDGPGIDEGKRHWVLERGARADTAKSGQGIGLAVVVELVSAYHGEIRIQTGSLGGAVITVRFG
jgi:two-component system sensor histidine kinase PhoQ